MGATHSTDPRAKSACDRCDVPLYQTHWVRVVAEHQGVNADRYVDTERRVCVDCLAAMGMLEHSARWDSEEQHTDPESNLLMEVRSRF